MHTVAFCDVYFSKLNNGGGADRRCCIIRLDLLSIWDRMLRVFMKPRDQSISSKTVHQYTMLIMDATANCMLNGAERHTPDRSLGNARMRMKAAKVWETTLFVVRGSKVVTLDVAKSTQAIMSMFKVLPLVCSQF